MGPWQACSAGSLNPSHSASNAQLWNKAFLTPIVDDNDTFSFTFPLLSQLKNTNIYFDFSLSKFSTLHHLTAGVSGIFGRHCTLCIYPACHKQTSPVPVVLLLYIEHSPHSFPGEHDLHVLQQDDFRGQVYWELLQVSQLRWSFSSHAQEQWRRRGRVTTINATFCKRQEWEAPRSHFRLTAWHPH